MASVPATTRQSDQLFLLGTRDLEPLSRLIQLPTIRQVLLRFHYNLQQTKSIRNASHATMEEVSILWEKASIPTTLPCHRIDKIEKIHSNWLLLKKNRSRSCRAQVDREQDFVNKLDLLFDVAHADALNLIKIDEDRHFLLDQRGKREMVMTTLDKDLVKKQARSLQRQRDEEERRSRAKAKDMSTLTPLTSTYVPQPEMEDLSTSKSDKSSEDEKEQEYTPSAYKKSRKSSTEKNERASLTTSLFTPQLTSALDRNKVSDREAVRLMVPLVAALGKDPSDLPISRTTIQRQRKKARKEFAEDMKRTFQPDHPLMVHWDGKIMPDIIGFKTVDRLPILVSGDGKEKLLGVPKLEHGTGKNASECIYNILQDWDIVDKIEGMCFDTTSVNTGHLNGACIQLEEKLGRQLLWVACRHHILELVLSKAFSLCFGPSCSPNIPLFKRFRTAWNDLKKDAFQVLEIDSEANYFRDNTLGYLLEESNLKVQSRDDYKELMELTAVILGHPQSKVHWKAPGPVHHARWMAKLIYAMKIYLFHNQKDIFQLTRTEEAQIKRFVTFGSLLYTSAWIQAPLPTEAPLNDLNLWLDLKQYEVIDAELSKSTRQVLERHLWYLSDELVGLAVFSDRVPDSDKKEIVHNMFTVKPTERMLRGNSAILKKVCVPKLGNFVTTRTKELFHKMKINTSFLILEPQRWKENEDYVHGQVRMRNLLVVNDLAERGVKLFEDYNKILTNDEDEKQFLLQVVEANRRAVPVKATKKATLAALKH